jgi:hypothetical protein
MAHFAKLNSDGVVLEVLVVSNDDVNNLPFPESEPLGVSFLENLLGVEEGIIWKQTSYNNNFRFRYAGIGFTYDIQRDAFIPPKRFPSWVFNEEKMAYTAPIPRPVDGKSYIWDENTLAWVEVERLA